ncbi:hypothetical protein ACV1DW_15955 [Aeromonas hydrophila]|jgi:hypothetical protein|uniref:hypothetical protein n=1 Tax=Aeromonas caviae TaxID=648 RepID=UPI003CE9C208
MTTENHIEEQGECLCTLAPAGTAGLEGYVEGEKYQFQRMSHDKHGKPYYRMFPSGEWPDYYETCGVSDFNRHFKVSPKEPTA